MGQKIIIVSAVSLLMGVSAVASAGFIEKVSCQPGHQLAAGPVAEPCPATEAENERLRVQLDWHKKELHDLKRSLDESQGEFRDTQARLSEMELAFAKNNGTLPLVDAAPDFPRDVPPEVYSLFFAFGTAEIADDTSGEAVDAIVQAVLYAEKILITGFSDDQGSREGNRAIALKRAEVAKQLLIDNGVAAEKIEIDERAGEYIASNATQVGRALNRRVDVRAR